MQDAVERFRFDLTKFLLGRTRAWGVVEDRFGRVRRKFQVEMEGAWAGDVFEINERFLFDDGVEETRVWRVKPSSASGQFTATCKDCVGEATGFSTVDRTEMRYRFRLQISGRSITVDFSDRIFLMDEGVAINRATMRKWGVRVGELSAVFVREGAGALRSRPLAA